MGPIRPTSPLLRPEQAQPETGEVAEADRPREPILIIVAMEAGAVQLTATGESGDVDAEPVVARVIVTRDQQVVGGAP